MRLSKIALLFAFMATGCQTPSVTQDNMQQSTVIDATKSIFPMEHYSQNSEEWIPSSAADYHQPVMDDATQAKYFTRLKANYFGTAPQDTSPWNEAYINQLKENGKAQTLLAHSVNEFLSPAAKYYGINFKELSLEWKNKIKENASASLPDSTAGRAIAVRETLLRSLPTIDPAFNDPRQPGEGYPFDMLQVAAIRPGTPLYIMGTSRDKAWRYVVSPAVQGWVQSDDVALTDGSFVTAWRKLSEERLGAFIKEPVSVNADGFFYFIARPGTLLPLREQAAGLLAAIPVKQADGSAQIKWVSVGQDEVAAMPLAMTRANLAGIIKSMQGKQYGWGDFNFYNDCSAELRSLLMPFGIFLPRNSTSQAKTGRVVDLSQLSVADRLSYLQKHGKPFTTLIHIDGHIMLYIGNANFAGKEVPMTYQNLWGLRTQQHPGRSIIGGSVFFPLLASYPENSDLLSPAAKPLFGLAFIE